MLREGGSSAAGSGDVTSQRTTADATTQGGRRTRGHPRDVGVVASGWRCGGNHCGNVKERATGEDLGGRGDGPDGWASSVSDDGVVMGGKSARAWRWATAL
jgi:hypothetical protein